MPGLDFVPLADGFGISALLVGYCAAVSLKECRSSMDRSERVECSVSNAESISILLGATSDVKE